MKRATAKFLENPTNAFSKAHPISVEFMVGGKPMKFGLTPFEAATLADELGVALDAARKAEGA